MNYKSEIVLLSTDLALGDSTREICPRCNGGSSVEKSLSITKEAGGVVWQCFRASCPEKGSTNPVSAHEQSTIAPTAPVRKRRVFTGTTEPLSEPQLRRIKNLWGIEDPPYWYWTNDLGGRVAMSIRSPKYTHRGWVLRDIRGVSRIKALTYVDEGQEGMSWYRTNPNAPTVVVEDIPSAVRASRYVNAVALCGTGIGPTRAEEIGSYATLPVCVALDQDATKDSFRLANKWSLLWGDVKVLPLRKDMKDMKEDELCKLLKL